MTKEKLEFKEVELNAWPAWITGKGVGHYKVVQYGKNWFAYIHEPWQSNWGQSCFRDTSNKSQEYATRQEAMAAAQAHADKRATQCTH